MKKGKITIEFEIGRDFTEEEIKDYFMGELDFLYPRDNENELHDEGLIVSENSLVVEEI